MGGERRERVKARPLREWREEKSKEKKLDHSESDERRKRWERKSSITWRVTRGEKVEEKNARSHEKRESEMDEEEKEADR
jgi:hypothetical protein